MTRRCSHCGHNGHNSRTCPDRGVRLFGVRLTESSSSRSSAATNIAMRKSASMGNLSSSGAGGGGGGGRESSSTTPEQSESGESGYVSDGLVHTSKNARERKKGVPWTEEEHRRFLLGLAQLGKGDWRGISRQYVTTRTPTQVASHAQKYYIRQSNLVRNRRRRSSLFDIPSETPESLQLVDLIAATNPPPLDPESLEFLRSHQQPEQSHLHRINYPSLNGAEASNSPVTFLPVYLGRPGPSGVVDTHEDLTKLTLGPSFSPSSPSPIKVEQVQFSSSPSPAPGASRSNPIRVS